MAGIVAYALCTGRAEALFPASLDELVPEDQLVRVIDLWVDRVGVAGPGFTCDAAKETGCPPHDPADLLKRSFINIL